MTSLVAHLLQRGGSMLRLAATSAPPPLNSPSPAWGEQPERVVVELSYQIEAAPSVQPSIGVWTALTPDHLDRHGTLERRSIKAGLLQSRGSSQCR